MKRQDVEKKIKNAIDNCVPNMIDGILSDCRDMKGTEIVMTKTNKTNKIIKWVSTAAAMLIIAGAITGFGIYDANYKVASTVSLDVNPSIELTVNKKDRVISVTPLNEDGKKVIGNMELKGTDIELAVNALIGSMVKEGYISQLANSILLSVEGGGKAETLEKKLYENIAAEFDTDSFEGAVISQTVSPTSELKKLADQYGITLGKAQLISRILKTNANSTFEELAKLSINELNLIAAGKLTGNVNSVGQASDKAYIGIDKAKEIALNNAGATLDKVTGLETDFDTEHGAIIYEVEFDFEGYEYEFDIDAKSGNIIKLEKTPVKTPANPDNTKPNDNQNKPADVIPDTIITVDEAKNIALNHADVSLADTVFEKANLDRDDGLLLYEIEFTSGKFEYEYEINAENGKIIDHEKERHDRFDDDDDGYRPPVTTVPAETTAPADTVTDSADVGTTPAETTNNTTVTSPTETITADEAKNIALTHAGISASDARFEKTELDRDDGLLVYEVEFTSGRYEYSYEINAKTGKILDYEKEIDD